MNEVETSAIEALLHAGGLAHPFPQIEKLRPSYFTAPFNLDVGDLWAVDHEHPFDTDALENAADCDRLIKPTMALGDHHPLVRLDAISVPFADPYTYTNCVSDINLWKIIFLLSTFKLYSKFVSYEGILDAKLQLML